MLRQRMGEAKWLLPRPSLKHSSFEFYCSVYFTLTITLSKQQRIQRCREKDPADNHLTVSDKQGPLRSESGEIGSAISDKDQLAGTPRPA